MILSEPPKPTFLKALIVVAIFAIPIAWFTHFMVRIPAIVFVPIAALLTLAAAWAVHSRVSDDWRSRWRMNFSVADRSSAVERNVRVKRR